LLDFNVQVALADQSLTEQELRSLLAGDEGLVWFKGQWVEVDRDKLQDGGRPHGIASISNAAEWRDFLCRGDAAAGRGLD
jgi:hypothetical protein